MTTLGEAARFVMKILAPDGGGAGVGVLVNQSELLTCAHVVNAALGLAADSQPSPGLTDVVEVCFPLLDHEEPQRFRARVEEWMPPPQRFTPGGDLARLKLLDLIPEITKPAVRDRDLPQAGRFVQVFGYPTVPRRPEGCWVEARIVNLVGRQRLQVDSLQDSAWRCRSREGKRGVRPSG